MKLKTSDFTLAYNIIVTTVLDVLKFQSFYKYFGPSHLPLSECLKLISVNNSVIIINSREGLQNFAQINVSLISTTI